MQTTNKVYEKYGCFIPLLRYFYGFILKNLVSWSGTDDMHQLIYLHLAFLLSLQIDYSKTQTQTKGRELNVRASKPNHQVSRKILRQTNTQTYETKFRLSWPIPDTTYTDKESVACSIYIHKYAKCKFSKHVQPTVCRWHSYRSFHVSLLHHFN